jgi:hypothetical protein
MATNFGECRLGDKTAKHRNFGKIDVWPKQSCHISQALAGRSGQSFHPELRAKNRS